MKIQPSICLDNWGKPWKNPSQVGRHRDLNQGPPECESRTLPRNHLARDYYYYDHRTVLPKGRSFTANSGTKAAVLSKGRSFTTNSRTQVAVLLRMDRCGSFLLLSTPLSLSLASEQTLKDPRGISVKVRRVDLVNCALRTSPKFTIGVKYQFHQGFWPGQRSGNPNHTSPPLFKYI